MIRWGLVARADQGGLANLSREIARHLTPDRILIVRLPADAGRGTYNIDRVTRYALDPLAYEVTYPTFDQRAVDGFLDGLDAVLCLETLYDPTFRQRTRRADVQVHLYAMPELLGNGPNYDADNYWIPEPLGTALARPSRLHQRARVLPFPCSTDVVHPVPRPLREDRMIGDRIAFGHQVGRAMEDRNGTLPLLAACGIYQGPPITVTIYGAGYQPTEKIGDVTINYDGRTPADWPDLYTDIDVLVQPRRYGWLSLPHLEAAAAGIPTITTDLHPQHDWYRGWGEPLLTDPGRQHLVPMKGGRCQVYDPQPAPIATAMQHLAKPIRALDYADRAHRWATSRSWEALKPRWLDALGGLQ